MTPERPRLARGEGGALRDEVVAAAEELLLRTGSDEAVSIRAVANAVGVTAPSIYRHFEDKTALIMAVCEKQFTAFEAAMEKATRNVSDPLDDLRARGEAYVMFGLEHPEAYAVMFMRPLTSFAGPPPSTDGQPGAYASLVESVTRAIESGALTPGDANHMAQVIWAAVHGLTSLLIAKPQFPWTDREALIDNILFAAVAPFLAAPPQSV